MKTISMMGMLILAATVTYMTGAGLIDTIPSTPDSLAQVYSFKLQVLIGVFL